ncbi:MULTISPECIES: siderophore ferric iron reductase [Aliivibrio]|uniref:Siderophore ferric iron reductase n=1 Tax=Aliivibrio finisterrensis TaxID=511998 RepID=A0A4V1Z9A7_9GAMM|nr:MULTISPECIES: siderophore ferric iron reductase [Aliivibrio]MDD9180438.1 siderophore ferric iron reductase [Aliivibrio sp. A6]RYU54845.1 siderophore ferric iron reductase [Aliivibrio finisterrensis]RYU56520.1 siderophore ferric iron reductase [Aliivibrio finisterrensis]RYU61641.1 siderophore ferric iron reductase [Aliivibrio finisterrensis]RYU66770.1 siderophore ferric iron reductase [Aliivibrio finisterrensis]
MPNNDAFELLFSLSKQITPYLSGQLSPLATMDDEYSIHISRDNSNVIQALYERLSQDSEEGGNAYWLTRTWDLLCWQPIYISFISVYQLHAIPDIQNMSQLVQSNFISGFIFHHSELTFGSPEEIVPVAASQLMRLFDSYREEISPWTRIRPGFTNHLLADGLLNCILKLQMLQPELSNGYLMAQAELWLNAFNLPNKHLSSLKVDLVSNQLKLVRTSCCLVYKCNGRKLCDDCPRHPDNKGL